MSRLKFKKNVFKLCVGVFFAVGFSCFKFCGSTNTLAMMVDLNKLFSEHDDTDELQYVYLRGLKDRQSYFKKHPSGLEHIYIRYPSNNKWETLVKSVNDVDVNFEDFLNNISTEYVGLKKNISQIAIYNYDNSILLHYDVTKKVVETATHSKKLLVDEFEEIEKRCGFDQAFGLLKASLEGFDLTLEQFCHNRCSLIITKCCKNALN